MLIRTIFVFTLIFICNLSSAIAETKPQSDKHFYIVPVEQRSDLDLITAERVSIRNRTKQGVVIYVDKSAINRLKSIGFKPQHLERDPARSSLDNKTDVFHDNEDINTIFTELANDYPTLTERFTVGYSVQNRPIYGIRINGTSDSVNTKTEIRIAGAIHGNEDMAVEMPLMMAQHLCENYGTDNQITDLVDKLDFYIIPLVNPDGKAKNTRENARGIDLNRNFGYQYHPESYNGEYTNSGMFSQPETIAMARHHLERNFTVSFIFHTTAAYVNYFWNFSERETPDEFMVCDLAVRYGSRTDYTPTQGYDWYQTFGDLNDFSYGSKGSFDYTIETANDDIAATWTKNRVAMLDAFEQAKTGLHGVIFDADSGEPLEAMVLCDNPFWPIYSDKQFGDYHRLLGSGDYYCPYEDNFSNPLPPATGSYPESYSCMYWAQGYESSRVENIVINGNNPTTKDVTLARNEKYYGFLVPTTVTNVTNLSYSPAALAAPDGRSYSLTPNGNIVIDMAMEMTSGTNNLLKVYEGEPYENEEYSVYVSNDFIGPWTYIGQGKGDKEFSLTSIVSDTARYVKISDNGSTSSSPYTGFDLDAIEYIISDMPDGDLDEDTENETQCEQPFECFDMFVTRDSDCAEANLQGKIVWDSSCRISINILPICGKGETQVLSLVKNGNVYSGAQNCTLENTDGSLWEMHGECGFYNEISANLQAIDCDGISEGTRIISSVCDAPCHEDGDLDLDQDDSELDQEKTETDSEEDYDSTIDGDLDIETENIEKDLDNFDADTENENGNSETDDEVDLSESEENDESSGCNSTSNNGSMWFILLLACLAIQRARRKII